MQWVVQDDAHRLLKEDCMEAIDNPISLNTRNQKRRDRVSTAELYEALEGLLPFAEVEIECLADHVETFPDDFDNAREVERVRQGKAAIELTRRLIARKTANIRRKQRSLREKLGQADQP
jgi:hypothetical protein